MRWRCVVMLATGFVLAGRCTLYAQAQPAQEVYKILGITVEGNTLADPTAVIANSGLRVNDEITVPGEQIAQAVRRLWSLRLFEDIQIAIDRKMGDGVFLSIKVKELPRFAEAFIEGNDEISTEDIEKVIALVKGQVLPLYELKRIEKEILKKYEKEGFLLAQVSVRTDTTNVQAQRVNIRITIDEGKEVEVESIRFEGNKALTEGDLRGAMDKTSETHWWKFWSSANFNKKDYDEDKKLIVQYYQKNGYRDAQILSDTMWYSDDKTRMTILMRVVEGPQYKVRNITWQGNTVFPVEALSERLNIKPGEVFNQEKYEKSLRGNEDQTDVASLYLDNGYLKINLEDKIDRVGEDSLDIHINVFEMNQFKIGQVSIKGNTKTQEKVIRRELYTRPGDYFSRANIIRSLRQLQQLQYFNPEKLKPDVVPTDEKTVDVTYEVEEKTSDNINASVGYSGAFGVTGALGFTINNFSITEPLTGGAGQILNFEWMFGEGSRYRTFTMGFTEPWLFGSPTLFGVTVFDTRQIYVYDYQRIGGSIRIGRRFRWPDDYFRGDWILEAQRNEVRDGGGIYREGLSSQVSITQVISRNSVDNPIFPTTGSNVSLSIQMSGGPLLPGNIDFHKWIFNLEWYVPIFGSSRLALYLGTQYGFIGLFEENSLIQPVDLFFMGGTGIGYIATTPLRGYVDQSIGPRNVNGAIIGGRAMTKQTAELRLSISMNPIPIFVTTFVEGGNVFESLDNAHFVGLNRSAGFGARLQIMPIGMIGFDYGYGFDDVFPRDGRPDGWHFHFVFGRGF